MSFPTEVGTLLKGAGLTNVKYGQLLDTPDAVVVVRPTGGPEDSKGHTSRHGMPRAQIIVRALTFDTAWANALIAKTALSKHNFSVDGTWYVSIEPIDYPLDLGTDTSNPPRRLVSFNVQAERKES